MKKALLLAIIACACVSASAWAQPPADCKPNALNIPNAPYPCIFPDGRVMFRVNAPDAQKVSVRIGRGLDMTKEADGLWYVTTPPQVVGFHYYTISIDGGVVSDPATRTFFGSGFDNSAIEVPEPDSAYYTPQGRAARAGAPALVLLEGDRRLAARPTSTRRPTTRPTPRRATRCCTSCTAGARTSRAGTPRAEST